MNKNTFYITTPIYYANDKPHIGHAYTTVLADVINRYQKLFGKETFFLTGTDEHGQKVQQAARLRGISEKQHVDEFHERFKEMWKLLGIEYNHFIRTTDTEHKQFVQKALQELYDNDQIYSQDYAGWYSVGEERFFNEDELVDGNDPISGRPVEWLEEKNYFFKMSQYQEKLINHINENPDFIIPHFRKNEVLGFLKKPLRDLCISRPKSRLEWGIPLPFDDDFVTYVWFDALLNYQSGIQNKFYANGDSIWPADFHILGKDILTTHCVYWPTMLMGMNRPLPRHFLVHGWWLLENKKMSKTGGNVVNPLDYIQVHGRDKVRYFLIREMTIGQDASFSNDLFIKRTNTELANDLGNAVNRVNKFIHSTFSGILPIPSVILDKEKKLQEVAENCIAQSKNFINEMKLSIAIENILILIRAVNKYIDASAPWAIAKKISENPGQTKELTEQLGSILYTATESLRIVLTLLWPVMPSKCKQGLLMLGIDEDLNDSHLKWGVLKGGESLKQDDALFPRFEVKKQNTQQVSKKNQNEVPPISKLEFCVAKITKVENHPDAKALYVLQINDGIGMRIVCAGLKNSYKAEELLNKRCVLFSNLKPAKLRGIQSNGMLLAADMPGDKAQLIDPEDIPIGTMLQFGNLTSHPKNNATIKDFGKVSIKALNGKVYFGEDMLHFQKTPVITTAPDGASIH